MHTYNVIVNIYCRTFRIPTKNVVGGPPADGPGWGGDRPPRGLGRGGRPHRLGPPPPLPWGPGGIDWYGDTERSYKAPTDYTNPPDIIQSPDRVYKTKKTIQRHKILDKATTNIQRFEIIDNSTTKMSSTLVNKSYRRLNFKNAMC